MGKLTRRVASFVTVALTAVPCYAQDAPPVVISNASRLQPTSTTHFVLVSADDYLDPERDSRRRQTEVREQDERDADELSRQDYLLQQERIGKASATNNPSGSQRSLTPVGVAGAITVILGLGVLCTGTGVAIDEAASHKSATPGMLTVAVGAAISLIGVLVMGAGSS